MKKIPFGVLAAVSIMAVSLITIVVVVLYEVDVVLTVEERAITIFDTWYQTLLFIADVFFAFSFIACTVLAVVRNAILRKEELKELKDRYSNVS